MNFAVPFLGLFLSLAYIILSGLFLKDRKRKAFETDGKYIQICGLIGIGLLGVLGILVLDISNNNTMKWFWLGFTTVAIGFQALLEWWFLKETKQYIISLFVLILGLIYLITFMF
ncbi:DUF4181 domain-containing protein [Virgibacillus halodenitrificans]|uniref:DUF4181 domain-containing protein n=1 Tax=Virgibacillus halodenitrificans TaxID=1482 RepID=UPI00045C7BED|nr:DUF4181 domain-containing protein [Virgibacillus halodenitrificans]CDQ32430.1 hypothetical protein BN993_01845 [Virgibacillus halodenitrificans]